MAQMACYLVSTPTADLLRICQLQRVEAPPHQSTTALRTPASARSAPPGFDSHHLQFCRQLPASRSPTLARLAPSPPPIAAEGVLPVPQEGIFVRWAVRFRLQEAEAEGKQVKHDPAPGEGYGGGGPCGGALFFPLPLSQVFIRPVSSS